MIFNCDFAHYMSTRVQAYLIAKHLVDKRNPLPHPPQKNKKKPEKKERKQKKTKKKREKSEHHIQH